MDDRQTPVTSTFSVSPLRSIALAIATLFASSAGAFGTYALMVRLAAGGMLPAALRSTLDPARPSTLAWPVSAAVGGMLCGLLAMALVARLPSRRRRSTLEVVGALAPVPLETVVAPAESLAWLHVVSGPSARRVGHAIAEMAGAWIARGERVLLIDGGPRLRLHVPLVAEPALGLSECLQQQAPLLGVVQSVGVPGLYLLVHGEPIPFRGWAGLGRLMEDARQHFDRVLLAVDLGAPYDIGRALAGRYFEAWWSDPAPERRAGAQALAERIGIRFRSLGLGPESQPLLEAVRATIAALTPAEPPAAEQLVVGGARPDPVATPALRREPLVLDCDLQVRERLRFLIWMRRIQREDRGPATFPPSRGIIAEVQTVTSG